MKLIVKSTSALPNACNFAVGAFHGGKFLKVLPTNVEVPFPKPKGRLYCLQMKQKRLGSILLAMTPLVKPRCAPTTRTAGHAAAAQCTLIPNDALRFAI